MVEGGHVVLDAGQAAVHLAAGGMGALIGRLGHAAMVQELIHVVAEAEARHGGGGVWGQRRISIARIKRKREKRRWRSTTIV